MPYQRLRTGERTGEYILDTKVGEGPETEVWKAKHHVLASPATVKVAYSERGATALQCAGVEQHTIRNPRIARIFGLNLENDPPYLVTEYVEGESLRALLTREGRLAWARFSGIFRDILDGLEAAHRAGKIHGNVTPRNILLDGGGRAVLTDFRGRRSLDAPDTLLSGVLAGGERATTIIDPYVPPDRREGAPADSSTDVWAAGLILFEVLTGKLPEGAESPSDLVRDLPGDVDRAFRGACTRPERRFTSAGEMAKILFGEPEEDLPVAKDIRIVSASATCACGHVNRVDYRYCVRCGARIGSPHKKKNETTCSSCGQPRHGAYKFCPFCGARYSSP
ncbi:MAG: serine/threonine-protein kinase [Planctomycetota bacterium]|jgi:serine/threonine-protein kinase